MPFIVQGLKGTVTIAAVVHHELGASGDGNCLYHSVGHFLLALGVIHHDDPQRLRDSAVDEITAMINAPDGWAQEARLAAYRHILANQGLNLDDEALLDPQYTPRIEGYLRSQRTDGTHGDELCILALARAFQVQIQVFLRSGLRIIDAEPDGVVALHRIRIVSCPFLGGVALNHYNPLTTVAPPVAPLAPQLPGRKGDPSLYWAGSPAQMALYVPPVYHGQYLVYPPRPGIGASMSSMFVSFTNFNVVDKPVQDVLSVVIRTAIGKQAPVLSLSYRFADFAVAGMVRAFRPNLQLPLAPSKKGPLPEDYPATEHSTVIVSLRNPTTHLRIRLLTRGRTEVAARKVALQELMDGAVEVGGGKGIIQLTLPLALLVPDELAASLDFAHSPYCLQIAMLAGDVEVPGCAFTYFSVPSPWDVYALEHIGPERVIFLGDDLRRISGAIKGVAPRTAKSEVPLCFSKGERDDLDACIKEYIKTHHIGSSSSYDPNTVNALYQRPDGRYFVATSWASVLVARRIEGVYHAQALLCAGSKRWVCVRRPGTSQFFHLAPNGLEGRSSGGKDSKSEKSEKSESGPQPTSLIIRNEFALGENKSEEWDVYRFPARSVPLAGAVTAGISSCAGGVTFTDEATPEWIILWHIDATPTIPVRALIESIWPDLDTCPALRSIGTVFPNPWEINKYRKENLYPEAIRDRCETILMPRGSGFYSGLNAVGCGQDFFGVLFSGSGQPSLGFSYDFDKRIDGYLSRARKRDPGEVSVTLLDYRASIFGTYRCNDTEIEDQNEDGMATLLDLTLKGDPGLRDDKKAHSRVAILDDLGSGLYGQLAGIASPVLETPGFFACEKAELDVAGHNDKRWLFVPIPEPVKSSGESSGAPRGDAPIVDGPDALPEEPPVMGPPEKPGDSGHAKDF